MANQGQQGQIGSSDFISTWLYNVGANANAQAEDNYKKGMEVKSATVNVLRGGYALDSIIRQGKLGDLVDEIGKESELGDPKGKGITFQVGSSTHTPVPVKKEEIGNSFTPEGRKPAIIKQDTIIASVPTIGSDAGAYHNISGYDDKGNPIYDIASGNLNLIPKTNLFEKGFKLPIVIQNYKKDSIYSDAVGRLTESERIRLASKWATDYFNPKPKPNLPNRYNNQGVIYGR